MGSLVPGWDAPPSYDHHSAFLSSLALAQQAKRDSGEGEHAALPLLRTSVPVVDELPRKPSAGAPITPKESEAEDYLKTSSKTAPSPAASAASPSHDERPQSPGFWRSFSNAHLNEPLHLEVEAAAAAAAAAASASVSEPPAAHTHTATMFRDPVTGALHHAPSA